MLGSRFLRQRASHSAFEDHRGEIDHDLVENVAKRHFKYRFVAKWLDIPIEDVKTMTHDELLVATQEAFMFRKQEYESNKQAVNNAIVQILNQLFGKGGGENGK